MREYSIDDIQVRNSQPVSVPVLGSPITQQEVEQRLSKNLYKQLSDNSESAVPDAINRAQIYVGAILRGFGVRFDLDNNIIREVVLLNAIYELHMTLGHAEAGKEYRDRAKDLILVTWGEYRDADRPEAGKVSGGSVFGPRPSKKYRRAPEMGGTR
ncbi:MAG: hypothetical protein IJQ27_04200 [Spirochaetia bacterium]|nr:hypothetical protein [Spirochaetia bacterium]